MATMAWGTSLTLAQIISGRETPDGKLAELVDVISQTNKIWLDATWIECNNGRYHEDKQTVSEPAGQLREYGQGVSPEAGVAKPIQEPTCMMAGLSKIDAKLLQHAAGGALANRIMEDGFFLRGLSKTCCNYIFNSNRATDPRALNGINVRSDYNDTDSNYVYDNANGAASATANKTSIYLFQWGHKRLNLTYPRNNPASGNDYGITMEDYGKDIETDPNDSSKELPMWRTWFECNFGIFIHDPRCVKRDVNVSTTNLDEIDDISFREDPLIDMVVDLEYDGEGAVFYCNRTIFKQAWKRAETKPNVWQQTKDPFGNPIVEFHGIPMRRVDKITDTQATVTS